MEIKRENILQYNYWEDWSIYDCDTQKELLRIPISKEYEINKEVGRLVNEIKSNKNYELIPQLIKLDRFAVTLIESELASVVLHSEFNAEDKTLLQSITNALNSNRGSNKRLNNLKEILRKDLEQFINLVGKKFEGNTVQISTKNYKSKLNKLWANYIKISRLILNALDLDESNIYDWEFVFLMFGIMIESIDKPFTPVYVEDKENRKLLLLQGFGVSGE